VLYSALTPIRPPSALVRVAFGAAIMTGATLTVLQAVDGVALKHAVDALAGATGPEKAVRFADAEVVRWIEWCVSSYFYTMLGVTLALFGVAMLRSILPKWLGWAAVVAGLAFVVAALPGRVPRIPDITSRDGRSRCARRDRDRNHRQRHPFPRRDTPRRCASRGGAHSADRAVRTEAEGPALAPAPPCLNPNGGEQPGP
jgi:hypothetical protein